MMGHNIRRVGMSINADATIIARYDYNDFLDWEPIWDDTPRSDTFTVDVSDIKGSGWIVTSFAYGSGAGANPPAYGMKVDGVNAPNKAYINSQYQDDGAFAGIYATPIEAGYSGSEATVTVDLLSVYRAARMGQYRYQSIWAAVYKVSGASVDSITTTTSTDWTSQYFRADLTSDDSLILLSQAYSKYGTRDFEVSPVDPEYAYEPFDGKREASPDILGGFPFTYSDVLTSRPQCRVAMAFNPLQ